MVDWGSLDTYISTVVLCSKREWFNFERLTV